MKDRVVGFVFARGGSKGVLRKNLKPLAGLPLIGHSIRAGQDARLVDLVIVSTDDEEIARVASNLGADVPFLRPPELAQDDTPEWLAWQHAITEYGARHEEQMDVFVSIPPTAPLRTSQDVDDCVAELIQSDADLVYAVKPAERNPYFNMVTIDDEGYANVVIPSEGAVHRRQDAPAVYDSTTVAYAARPAFVLDHSSMWEGRIRVINVPRERSLDLDTELDFKIAEVLLAERAATSTGGEL